MNNQLRIIAGKWRGRKFPVVDTPGLRPTSDRTRETLFNWLQQEIVGARCLDLFAGTGALGLEALSRGAAETVFVEQRREAVQALHSVLNALGTTMPVYALPAQQFLHDDLVLTKTFDYVFLDPPFAQNLLAEIWELLTRGNWLGKNTVVYLEHEKELSWRPPAPWAVLKQKHSKVLSYSLYRQPKFDQDET